MTAQFMRGHLETAREVLRAQSVQAGREIELRKVEGAKMREIRKLETEYHAALSRFYSIDAQLRGLR